VLWHIDIVKLIYIATGKEVVQGDVIGDGDEALTIIGLQVPYRPSSTGRVYVKNADGTGREIYPDTIGMKFVNKD
jgi:hypothetical protein